MAVRLAGAGVHTLEQENTEELEVGCDFTASPSTRSKNIAREKRVGHRLANYYIFKWTHKWVV